MSTSTSPATRASRKPPVSDRVKGERSLGWKLAGPAFVIMIAVTAYPIAQALYTSLFSYRMTDPNARKFKGLGNYGVILDDPLFWNAMGVTVFITVVTVVIELVLGFIIAMTMHRVVIPRRTLRTIVLLPYSIITVVSAFAWQFGFSVTTGFVNNWAMLGELDWFGGKWTALFVICLSEIWKTTPFMSLLLLSGLAQIDTAMEEAAKVDGATFMQRLNRVILPNMKPAILVALLFRTLDAFRIYDNIAIMTGGSHDTSSLSILAVNQTISRVEIGMGSAISTVLFICVVIIAVLFIKGFKVDLAQGRG